MRHVTGTQQEYGPPMDMFTPHPPVPAHIRLFLPDDRAPCEDWQVELDGHPLKFNEDKGCFESKLIHLREEIKLCANENGRRQVEFALSTTTDARASGATPVKVKIKIKPRIVGPEGTPASSSSSGDAPNQSWDLYATQTRSLGGTAGLVSPVPETIVLDLVPGQLNYRRPSGDALKKVGTDEALAIAFELPS